MRAPSKIFLATVVALAMAGAHPAASAVVEAGVDADVVPGDDFFAWANGGWLRSTEIPGGAKKWSAGSEIAARTREQVARLLDDTAGAPAGSPARRLADFRAAWLDEAAIEARGMAPLQDVLGRIDRIRDRADLTRYLGAELAADVDPMNTGVYDSQHLLGIAVQAGNHGETTWVAYLLQGGLGLPGRESYLDDDARPQARRKDYEAAMARVLTKLGPGADAAARAGAVMALETAIARSHATPEASADDHNADTLWTSADFAREAPGMDWSAFFAAAGLARQPAFVAWQPSAVKGAAALVGSQPLPAWQDYLRIRTIARHADLLPRSLSAEAMALRRASLGLPAAGEGPPRAQRALEATQSALADELGRLYTERHFPPAHKARVQAIVADVVASFKQRVESAAWMSPAARAMSLAKLNVLYFGVGYPERRPDDASLVIDPANAMGNLRRVAERNRLQALARLGQPVDRREWVVAPQWPGAVLLFHENAYNFAAALLQPPKFDPAASDAANYGAIGAIVGHEVSHFVDGLGADYDAEGRLRRWWSDDDMARYRAVTEPLVRQFSGYRPMPDVAVDGQLGLSENLADLGGLVAAFDAYRRTLGSRAADKDHLREQDRQFFIGFARAWRAKYTGDGLRAQAASDHAPETYRVSTVRNVDAWYDAFDVKPGQRLYLEPAARVRIW